MNKTSLPDESKIACCLTCTLGTVMRDCKNCPFNIGLIVKGLQAIKQAENIQPAQVDTVLLISNLTLSLD